MSPARRSGADQTRFTRLAETAGPRILGYLARRIDPPGDASDVLAEVLAIAWRRVADLPADEGAAAAWLFGIARGTLANHRRGQARRHALADRLRDHVAQRQREAAPAADEMIAVRDALGRLAPGDRELLTLVAWDGLRADQAAAIRNQRGGGPPRLVLTPPPPRRLDTGPDATTVNDGPPTFTPTDTWPRSAFKR